MSPPPISCKARWIGCATSDERKHERRYLEARRGGESLRQDLRDPRGGPALHRLPADDGRDRRLVGNDAGGAAGRDGGASFAQGRADPPTWRARGAGGALTRRAMRERRGAGASGGDIWVKVKWGADGLPLPVGEPGRGDAVATRRGDREWRAARAGR